jgi:hypothetical protein
MSTWRLKKTYYCDNGCDFGGRCHGHTMTLIHNNTADCFDFAIQDHKDDYIEHYVFDLSSMRTFLELLMSLGNGATIKLDEFIRYNKDKDLGVEYFDE